jgi:hypothetical protein
VVAEEEVVVVEVVVCSLAVCPNSQAKLRHALQAPHPVAQDHDLMVHLRQDPSAHKVLPQEVPHVHQDDLDPQVPQVLLQTLLHNLPCPRGVPQQTLPQYRHVLHLDPLLVGHQIMPQHQFTLMEMRGGLSTLTMNYLPLPPSKISPRSTQVEGHRDPHARL